MERIYVTKKELIEYEKDIRTRRHLERYWLVRQYCYGVVVDCACGVGYGSYIIQTNPDVSKVYGIDVSAESIRLAGEEFSTDKTNWVEADLKGGGVFVGKANVLVSIETIEHLENPLDLVDMAIVSQADDIILSYPTKKSTNFNKYHYYDFYEGDIKKMFGDYRLYNKISIGNEVDILMLTKRYDSDISSKRMYY